ncbi:MAG: TIGR04086 family membrane protein [Clostridia bacterium]|nr:TIGR04086 family membrane protein [Clostridia bacterium]
MSEKNKINFRGIGKGIIFSIILTAIFIVLIATVTYFIDISDKIVSVLLFSSTVISTLIGALLVTKGVQQNGLIHGMFVGLGFFILILISSIITNKGFNFNINLITMLLANVAGGMLGGILGINSK